MCKCDPTSRTPYCGRPGCERPAQQPPDPVAVAARDQSRLANEVLALRNRYTDEQLDRLVELLRRT